MQDVIISETSKIFMKGIKNYSKKYGVELTKVSILLYIKGEEEVGYQVYKEGTFCEEITIKDILGVKLMDLRGYSVIAPPYIYKFLINFAKELNSMKVDVSIYMNESEEDIDLFLYENGNFIRQVFLKDIISDKIGT